MATFRYIAERAQVYYSTQVRSSKLALLVMKRVFNRDKTRRNRRSTSSCCGTVYHTTVSLFIIVGAADARAEQYFICGPYMLSRFYTNHQKPETNLGSSNRDQTCIPVLVLALYMVLWHMVHGTINLHADKYESFDQSRGCHPQARLDIS